MDPLTEQAMRLASSRHGRRVLIVDGQRTAIDFYGPLAECLNSSEVLACEKGSRHVSLNGLADMPEHAQRALDSRPENHNQSRETARRLKQQARDERNAIKRARGNGA